MITLILQLWCASKGIKAGRNLAPQLQDQCDLGVRPGLAEFLAAARQ
jgi:hypothetical protein